MTLMGCVPLVKDWADRRLDLEKALDLEKSLNEGAILLPGYKVGSWFC